jgi:hypothetical protein
LPTIEGTASNSNQVPWDPWLCIMLALGSMVVHHAGPGIHGCASCWPWDPWLCTMLARGSMVVHHAGPVGDDRFADHRGNSN